MIGLITQNGDAQTSAPSPQMVAANKLMQAKKWSEAENSFASIVKSEPKNARAWYSLGIARHSQEKWTEAIAAFKKNIEIAQTPFAMYNVAAGYARLDKKDLAFEWLEKALNNGAAFGSNLNSDDDFANIKGDARFQDMLKIVDQKINPCMYSREARQFDFWIGDWDVFVQGRKVGENLVEREVNGCILVENWKNTGGGTGKSINVYNAVSKKWKQFYVGSQGGVLDFEGEYKENEKILHLTGETFDAKGAKTLHILNFHDLPDKTVRQHWQQSTDDGKTWNTVWDSIYKRKATAKK
jgi:tetratricopeptide (TPR) repeat protein